MLYKTYIESRSMLSLARYISPNTLHQKGLGKHFQGL